MKLNPELESAFADQVTTELEASTVYRQLAIEVDVVGPRGMASWLRHQADEEIVHANKFIDHMVDRGNHPIIGDVSAPKVNTESVKAIFEAAYAHEQKVSESIRNLYRLSEKAGDVDSRPLLNWFLEEQIEEEATVSEILDKINLVSDDGNGLLRLDAELSHRPTRSTEAGSE